MIWLCITKVSQDTQKKPLFIKYVCYALPEA